jgi:SAM-dependent methyltransferase
VRGDRPDPERGVRRGRRGLSLTASHGRDAAATKAFFDRWSIYGEIIRGDYMRHRGIHDALRSALAETRETAFAVLDLGCGDAAFVAATLDGLPVRSYTGVDLSDVALGEARRNLVRSPFRVSLVASDFMTYLRGRTPPVADVVIAGFSVHHLSSDEKADFFALCAGGLPRGGALYLYDVVRRPGESRAEYIEAYLRACEREWTGLPVAHLSAVQEHVRLRDFPEAPGLLARLGQDAGLVPDPAPLFLDDAGFHALLRFRV